MKDNADPLDGWSLEDVADVSSGPATADIYGKLFYYIRQLLRSFLDRLSSLDVSFKLFQVDASFLPDHFELDAFSRIEVGDPLYRSPILHQSCILNNSKPCPIKGVLIQNVYENTSLITLHRCQTSRMLAGWEYTTRSV